MKRKLFTTVCFLLISLLTGIAQTSRTYKIELDRDDFEFVNFKGYFEIVPLEDLIYHEEIINAPMILYQSFEIVLPEQEKLKNISFAVGKCTQITDAILTPYWGAVHSGTDASETRTVDIPYEIKDYPFEFEYHEPATNGRRTVVVSFNIFAYNAITKTISWPENFSITVETEPLEQWEYVSWAMPDGWGLLEDIDPYLNPEDFWKEKKIPSIVGSVWSYVNYATTTNGQEAYDFFRYTVLDEPKEMNGHTYYPMVKYNTCEYIPGKEELRVYLREEGCRIYKYLEQEGEETLLYDFAIQPYDQYFKEQHNYFKTVNEKALNITKQEKCTTAEDGFPFRKMVIGNNMTWVDGIGNIKDFLAEYETKLEGTSVLNYYRSGNGQVVYKNAFSNLTSYKADDCALGTNAVKEISIWEKANIQVVASTITCTSPTATKLEVYTMDAVKVGEAAFASGEATVKVGKTPATYLYIVTYPNGRRESGKVAIGH